MDRELLLEIGCEELPASWLPALTEQLAQRLGQRLKDFRLSTDGPVESSATPRRLTAHVTRVAERQSDLEENVSGPAVAAAFGPDGAPTPAAVGFARKYGVEVSELTRVTTAKGEYLSVVKRERGRAAVDILPDVLGATLRDLPFPKQMRWDAWIDDGKGEFTFGRPIRWMLFLFGGRVVPFVIRRSPGAQSNLVQDVRSGALTYGHRFLAMSGRPGRSVKVRSVSDYKQRLGEHFILLEHSERHDRLVRELDAHARRLGGRVASQPALLHEVADLVEYPSVVAGVFPPEFLALPDEVLTTTMIHHQHYFPVLDEQPEVAAGVSRGDQHRGRAAAEDRHQRRTGADGPPPRCAVLLGCRSPGRARSQAGAPRHPAVPQGARQLRRQGATPRAAGTLDRHRGVRWDAETG